MANNAPPPRPLFFLQAAWTSFLANKEVVVLLALLYAMITLLIPSAVRDLIVGGEAAMEALLSSPEATAEAAPSLFFAWLVLLVPSSVITVMISRVIVLGRQAVMDGGGQALVRRGLKVFARSLGALFWILLYVVPVILLVSVFSGGPIAGQGDGLGPQAILFLLLLLWTAIVVAAVVAAFFAAALAESVDRPLKVQEGWTALKGKRKDLAGSMLILWVVMVLVMAIIGPLVTGVSGFLLGSTAANVINYLVSTILSGIVVFVLMAGTFFVLGVTAPGLLAPAAAGPSDENQDD